VRPHNHFCETVTGLTFYITPWFGTFTTFHFWLPSRQDTNILQRVMKCVVLLVSSFQRQDFEYNYQRVSHQITPLLPYSVIDRPVDRTRRRIGRPTVMIGDDRTVYYRLWIIHSWLYFYLTCAAQSRNCEKWNKIYGQNDRLSVNLGTESVVVNENHGRWPK